MRLRPATPPGHLNRKAREFEDEIAQLWTQGYTLAAIRAALAAVGVQVSISSVWREVSRAKPGDVNTKPARARLAARGVEPLQGRQGVSPSASEPVQSALRLPLATDRPSGKDIAEEFRRRQTTNHLLRAKEQR